MTLHVTAPPAASADAAGGADASPSASDQPTVDHPQRPMDDGAPCAARPPTVVDRPQNRDAHPPGLPPRLRDPAHRQSHPTRRRMTQPSAPPPAGHATTITSSGLCICRGTRPPPRPARSCVARTSSAARPECQQVRSTRSGQSGSTRRDGAGVGTESLRLVDCVVAWLPLHHGQRRGLRCSRVQAPRSAACVSVAVSVPLRAFRRSGSRSRSSEKRRGRPGPASAPVAAGRDAVRLPQQPRVWAADQLG